MDKEREEIYKKAAQAIQATYLQMSDDVPCADCGGSGRKWKCQPACHHMGSVASCIDCGLQYAVPCPTCTPKRKELIAKAEKYCQHEWKYHTLHGGYFECVKCKKDCGRPSILPTNPSFTIESIAAVLKDMGLWDEFEDDANLIIVEIFMQNPDAFDGNLNVMSTLIGIIITPELLAQAVTSFLEGKLNG